MAIQRRGKCLYVGGRLPGISYEVDWTLEDTCFEKENAETTAVLVKVSQIKLLQGLGQRLLLFPSDIDQKSPFVMNKPG